MCLAEAGRAELARLEALCREDQDPLHAWRALDLCNSWTGGPYHAPPWCVSAVGSVAHAIAASTARGSAPLARELQRSVMAALDLTSKGRNSLKTKRHEMSRMIEAGVFNIYRAAGASPAWIYHAIYDKSGAEPNNSPAELRKRQGWLAEGRRLLKLAGVAYEAAADNPVEHYTAALADALRVRYGPGAGWVLILPRTRGSSTRTHRPRGASQAEAAQVSHYIFGIIACVKTCCKVFTTCHHALRSHCCHTTSGDDRRHERDNGRQGRSTRRQRA